jgi:hypothetical protein
MPENKQYLVAGRNIIQGKQRFILELFIGL